MNIKVNFYDHGTSPTVGYPTIEGMNLAVTLEGLSVFSTTDVDANIASINGTTVTVGDYEVTIGLQTTPMIPTHLEMSLDIIPTIGGNIDPRTSFILGIAASNEDPSAGVLETNFTWTLHEYNLEYDVYLRRNNSPLVIKPAIGLQPRPWSNDVYYHVLNTVVNGTVDILDTEGNIVCEGRDGVLPAGLNTYTLRITEGTVVEQLNFSITGEKRVPQISQAITSTGGDIYQFATGVDIEIQALLDFESVLQFNVDGNVDFRACKRFTIVHEVKNAATGNTIFVNTPISVDDMNNPATLYDPSAVAITITPSVNNLIVITTIGFYDWNNHLIIEGSVATEILVSPIFAIQINCLEIKVQKAIATDATLTISRLNLDGTFTQMTPVLTVTDNEVIVVEFTGSTGLETLPITEGVYKFTMVSGEDTWEVIRIVDCTFIKCVYNAIINLAQGDLTPCCDDCKDEYTLRRFNYSALITMYNTYLALLSTKNLMDAYVTEIDVDIITTLTDIAQLFDASYAYCSGCGDVDNDCAGCK